MFGGGNTEKPKNEAEEIVSATGVEETIEEDGEVTPPSLDYQKEVELMKPREVNLDGTIKVPADEKLDKAA